MNIAAKIPLRLYAVLFGVAFLMDRLTKAYAVRYAQERLNINGIVSYILEFNRGISWSFFSSDDTRIFVAVTIFIAAIIVGLALYSFVCWMNHKHIVGQVLVLAGALSNIVDRIVYGGVVDFMLLQYKSWSWPVFNLADACIVVGVALMLYQEYE